MRGAVTADLGVSAQQAPKTQGSPCCHANIHDRQTLFSGTIYRGCGHCGAAIQSEGRWQS